MLNLPSSRADSNILSQSVSIADMSTGSSSFYLNREGLVVLSLREELLYAEEFLDGVRNFSTMI